MNRLFTAHPTTKGIIGILLSLPLLLNTSCTCKQAQETPQKNENKTTESIISSPTTKPTPTQATAKPLKKERKNIENIIQDPSPTAHITHPSLPMRHQNTENIVPFPLPKHDHTQAMNQAPHKENMKHETNADTPPIKADEIILFCGNPGSGKSALCNSIFQQAIFRSGISRGSGMTTHQQEHIYNNKLYIDTPGLSDVQMRKQAAKEIEKALKYNHHYKIVFVATLEAGRIRPDDLVTVNLICDIIRTPFEYGLIFNKLTDFVYQDVLKNGLNEYLITLHKPPHSIALLKEVNEMQDTTNTYFPDNSENRIDLLKFLTKLPPFKIKPQDITPIDTRDFDERIQEMEEEYNREIAELIKKEEKQAEQMKRLKEK
eukprot:gene133-182_t